MNIGQSASGSPALHTEGPWLADAGYVAPVGDSGLSVCAVMPVDRRGGTFYRGPRTLANERLIASSPKLLAQLRRTESNLSRLIDSQHHDAVLMTPWRDEVRAALAEAGVEVSHG